MYLKYFYLKVFAHNSQYLQYKCILYFVFNEAHESITYLYHI